MTRSAAVNAVLLIVALGGVVAFFFDKRSPEEQATKKNLSPPKPAVVAELEQPKDPFPDAEMQVYRRILASFATGDFAGAIKLAENALASPATSETFRDWIHRQLPVMMTSEGWLKIKTQDCDEAIKIFYRVLATAAVPEAQKGLGFCLRSMKNWPEAASYLATYILARPSDIEGRLIYADTLESLGRFDEAVNILEGAVSQTNQDPAILELAKQRLQGMRAKAKEGAKQRTERSEHFYVSYREEDHDAILRPILEILETSLMEYAETLGITPPATPIEVILYRREEFHDVIPGGPGWAEGIFDGRMRIPVSSGMAGDIKGSLTTVLRHELSHAVLSVKSAGRAWPIWFDEGLAQYLSCLRRDCDQFKFPPTPGTFTPLDDLTKPFVTLDRIEAGRAYLHSLYMLRRMVRQTTLDDIIARIPGTGTLTSDLIAEAGRWDSFKALWDDVNRYWTQKQPW